MNNFKKIGLSALAGSLVAISANAAELTVTGGVEVTYVSKGGDGVNDLTGNAFGANSNITFAASGDVGFGTVAMNRALSDTATMTTSYQTLDMGDMGVFSFDSLAGALVGLTANDDGLPTAYEEVWTGVSADGITGVGSTNVIGYRNTISGIDISLGYTDAPGSAKTAESSASGHTATAGGGTATDWYLSMSPIEGLTVGAGQSVNTAPNGPSALNDDTVERLAKAVYTTGPISVGYKGGDANIGTAATASTSVNSYTIAFNINDNLAISYGEQERTQNAIGATAEIVEDVTGVSAAYTMGAASIRFNRSEASNALFATGTDSEKTEISLALAF